jgi:hypothetical protein
MFIGGGVAAFAAAELAAALADELAADDADELAAFAAASAAAFAAASDAAFAAASAAAFAAASAAALAAASAAALAAASCANRMLSFTGQGSANTELTHFWKFPLFISANVTILDLPLITATVWFCPNGITTTYTLLSHGSI